MRTSYAWRNPLKTRPNDVKVRRSLAVFLLFTLGLFASWSHAAEGKPGTDASSISQKEQADRPTRPYNDYALFIAGINNPKGSLAALESSPAWGQFAKSFNASWKSLEVRQLTPIRQWAARELSAVEAARYTVFYPFSGADFANMYNFFPNAGTYVMISLERVGRIPDFPAMSKPDLEAFFASLERVNKDLLGLDYFISNNLEAALQGEGMQGILPLLLLFMAREKVRVIDVQHWFMNPNTAIEEMPALERVTSDRGSIPGVRIAFQREGQDQTQTLYYFRFNLARGSFDRNDKFVSLLKSFGPLITLEKAASYLMFDPDFDAIRQFILDHSMHILQTDSGIPIKYFDPSTWSLKLFGTYQKPVSAFSDRYQKDLAELYQKTKNVRPISFGVGYHHLPGTANLLLATRKATPPSGEPN
jgi:hypothetical protein